MIAMAGAAWEERRFCNDRRLVVMFRRLALLLTSVLAVPLVGADALAQTASDPVKFHAPTFVVPPPTLLGDAGDGRCPNATEKCYRDVQDILYGQTHLMREDDIVFAYPGGFALLTTSESTISGPGKYHYPLFDGSARYSAPAVVGARMFDTASDVAVTVILDRSTRVLNVYLAGELDLARGELLRETGAVGGMLVDPGSDIVQLKVIAGDFTGDGFDEIVIFPAGPAMHNAVVASAVDTKDPTKGIKFGQPYDLFGQVLPFTTTKASVQGQPRVFVAGPSEYKPSCNSKFSGLHFQSYTVHPVTLNLTSEGTFKPTLPEGTDFCLHVADMTSGRFSTPLRDQLLVAYARDGGTVKLLPIDLNDRGFAVPGPVFDSGVHIGAGWSGIRAGRLVWNSPLDLAVLFISNNLEDPNLNSLRIIGFDQNFTPTVKSTKQGTGRSDECAADFMLGNFDHHSPTPDPPPAPPPSKDSLFNPNLQIATLTSNCREAIALRIWNVNPDTFAITKHGVDFNYKPGPSVFRSAMAPVDLQGRSFRVGPPAIVTIEHTQPSVVLSAVPMHVDAVVPAGDGNPPFGIANISGMPSGLQTSFKFASTSDTSSKSTSTSSATFSAQESLEAHEAIGDCDEGPCESVKLHTSFSQKVANSDSATNGTFNSTSQDLASATGFQDSVTYENSTLTTYIYPVLGQTVCPSSTPGCADSEKIPLRAVVAGPDTVTQILNADGDILPWYQPSWIPGNILSYPGNSHQLMLGTNGIEDFQDYADSSKITLSASGTLSTETRWTGGSSSGSSSGVDRDFSYEQGVSVVYQVTIADVLNVGGSADLDFGESTGFSGLTEVNKTVDATQGIGFTQSAILSNPDYIYTITPHIFGRKRPVSSVNDNTTPADVQIFGALRTAYEVDVDNAIGFGGSYWDAWYGQAPDLALNQPMHWKVTPGGSVSLGTRLPQGLGSPIWLSHFHIMRGFFISNSASGQGPQVTSATTGDQLTLTARVYNLSLAEFPPDTTVHVRFMGMPWNTASNTQAGDSFLIGETDLPLTEGLLPPHNSGTNNPNWALASVKFDTSGTNCGGNSCDGLDLLFWVVVWAEGPVTEGTSLVTELRQHGLASIPADGEDFLQVALREQTYSNNLGVYNQVFHIFGKEAVERAPTPSGGDVGARIVGVGASVRELNRGETVALATKVETGGRDLNSGLAVGFYGGDPRAGAKLVGFQRLPFLNANSEFDYRVLLQPHACGIHTIYAVAGEGTRHEHVAKFKPFEVKCPDAARLSARVIAKTGLQHARQWTVLVSNTGASKAGNAQLDALKLTQTGGMTCTPTVSSPSSLPLEIGDIAAGASASAFVTINFAGCVPTARFRADLAFSSDNGSVPGSATINNQFR